MRFLFSTLASIVLAGPLAAQAVNARFLPWDDEIAGRELAAVSGGKLQPITGLHPLQRSPAVKVTPTEGRIVVRALDKPGDGDKPAEFEVKLAPGMKRPLVIFMPDPKSPTGLRGQAFEDATDRFAWGSYRLINITGKPLLMSIGKNVHKLPSGWTPVDIPFPGDKPLPVIFVLEEDKTNHLWTGVWEPDPQLRKLVIVVPSEDRRLGALALKVIPEDRLAEEQPAASAQTN